MKKILSAISSALDWLSEHLYILVVVVVIYFLRLIYRRGERSELDKKIKKDAREVADKKKEASVAEKSTQESLRDYNKTSSSLDGTLRTVDVVEKSSREAEEERDRRAEKFFH